MTQGHFCWSNAQRIWVVVVVVVIHSGGSCKYETMWVMRRLERMCTSSKWEAKMGEVVENRVKDETDMSEVARRIETT